MLVVLPTLAPSVASSLEPVGDPESTRTVYITVVALLGLAVGLGVLAVWLWKRTTPEPALLAPLEEMDSRSFRQLDADQRRNLLEEVRPRGWRPVAFEDYEGPDPDDQADDETVAYHRIEDPDAPTVAYVRTTMSTTDPPEASDPDESEPDHPDEPETEPEPEDRPDESDDPDESEPDDHPDEPELDDHPDESEPDDSGRREGAGLIDPDEDDTDPR